MVSGTTSSVTGATDTTSRGERMAAVLSARGLSKEFRGFRAVDDVDLEVPEGGVHALVGPNGAGKTTLFNLLTGFLKPTRGRISLGTHELAGRAPEQIARLGVARAGGGGPRAAPPPRRRPVLPDHQPVLPAHRP